MVKKRCALYMRYSSDNQNETSIEYQRAELEKYCATYNHEIVEEYVERAHTGTHDRRPVLERLVDDVKNHPAWDTILVYRYDRIARNLYDSFYLLKVFRDCNVELISIREPIDDEDDFGQIHQALIFYDNQRFSKKLATDVRSALKNKASKGGHCGGIPPLGYVIDENGDLKICEEEAEIVREIFDLVEQGRSYQWMVDYLNSQGYKTKHGTPFKKNSFLSILRQEKYKGVKRWNRCRARDKRGRRNNNASKPDEEQIIKECPAIISEEQFDKVQKRLKMRSGGCAESKSHRNYVLGGMMLLTCAECGRYMVGSTQTSHGNTYEVYRCPNHKDAKTCSTKDIRADTLNKFVALTIAKHLIKTSTLSDINKALVQWDRNSELCKKRDRLKKSIERLASVIEQSYSKPVADIITKRCNELESIEKIIANNKAFSYINDNNKKSMQYKLVKYIETSDSPAVKKLILQVVENIQISNNEVVVVLKNVA